MTLPEGGTLVDGLILFAGVLALTFFSLVLLRRNRRRVAESGDKAREQFERLRGHSELRGSMDGLVLQLEDVSRRVNAQLDTKFIKLETIIRDADERIARLEGVLGRLEEAQRTPVAAAAQMGLPEQRAGSDPRPAPKPLTPSSQPMRSSQGNREADGLQPAGPSLRSGDSGAPGSADHADVPHVSSAPPMRPAAVPDERDRRIYELADDGMTAIKIAETVGLPLGEVELILNLRRFG